MYTSKVSTKTETQLASIALFHALKSIASFILYLTVYYHTNYAFITTFALLPFVYYTYVAIEQKAFIVLWSYFQRVLKYRKVHGFFEEIQKTQSNFSFKQYLQKYTSSIGKNKYNKAKSQAQQAEQQYEKTSAKPQTIYIPAPKPKQQQLNIKPQSSKKQLDKKYYEQQYLKIRQNYKKSFEIITEPFEQFTTNTKNTQQYYTIKLQQFLKENESNLADMKAQLQKHYFVHILQNDQSQKSMKLINVTIDQAIARIQQFQRKRCFPWGEKMGWDPIQTLNHHKKILEMADDRFRIDYVLAPNYMLNQQTRTKVIAALKNQMETNIAGVQLVDSVVHCFNNQSINLGKHIKYLIFKEGKANQGLEIVSTRIGNRLHVDLRIKRKEKDQLLVCNPGPNNLWTLIRFAQQINKQNL